MAIHIQRREFIVTLGGAAAWPLAVALPQYAVEIFEKRKKHAAHRSHRHQSRRFGEGNQVL
jgi:hypothetical protein